jgi:DNA repair exonuclease SbcCD ATPase subunit
MEPTNLDAGSAWKLLVDEQRRCKAIQAELEQERDRNRRGGDVQKRLEMIEQQLEEERRNCEAYRQRAENAESRLEEMEEALQRASERIDEMSAAAVSAPSPSSDSAKEEDHKHPSSTPGTPR